MPKALIRRRVSALEVDEQLTVCTADLPFSPAIYVESRRIEQHWQQLGERNSSTQKCAGAVLPKIAWLGQLALDPRRWNRFRVHPLPDIDQVGSMLGCERMPGGEALLSPGVEIAVSMIDLYL
jgi:hypothetical protein